MSSEGSPHEISQSGQGGGRGSSAGTSHRDHDGDKGRAGLYDGSTVKDGSSIKAPIADKGTSSMMKTELAALCTISSMISCEPASCRCICKGVILIRRSQKI